MIKLRNRENVNGKFHGKHCGHEQSPCQKYCPNGPAYYTFSPLEAGRVQTYTEGKFTGREGGKVPMQSLYEGFTRVRIAQNIYCVKCNKQGQTDRNKMSLVSFQSRFQR